MCFHASVCARCVCILLNYLIHVFKSPLDHMFVCVCVCVWVDGTICVGHIIIIITIINMP